MVGDVAFLTVTALGPLGAFFDWGLPRELLVPPAEQTRPLAVGDRHAVGVYLDVTGRVAGTMRVDGMLAMKGDFRAGEWVQGEAWRSAPEVGTYVIVEQRVVGRVPPEEPTNLKRGEAAAFRVIQIVPDGKIELSLREQAHDELAKDAAYVLHILGRSRNGPLVNDHSSPEKIRAFFGLSKNAFKRAVGSLLSLGELRLDKNGFLRPRQRRT
jgi:predicted RNA-binding protein (virulence factor B family)